MNPAGPVGLPAEGAEPTAESTPPAAGTAPAAVVPARPAVPESTDRFEQEFRNVRLAGGFYAAMLLPLLIAAGWSYHTRNSAVEIDFWASGALYAVIAVYAMIWRRDWWSLVCLPLGDAGRWLAVAGLAPLVSISAAGFLRYWAVKLGLPVHELMTGYGEDGYPVWLLALQVVVLAPLFEEVAFRGVLTSRFQRVMSPVQAIWVSATLFGVLHLSVLSMAVFLVPLGAVAGYLTRETKSLLPAMAIHAAHNAGVLLLGW